MKRLQAWLMGALLAVSVGACAFFTTFQGSKKTQSGNVHTVTATRGPTLIVGSSDVILPNFTPADTCELKDSSWGVNTALVCDAPVTVTLETTGEIVPRIVDVPRKTAVPQ